MVRGVALQLNDAHNSSIATHKLEHEMTLVLIACCITGYIISRPIVRAFC